MILDTVNNLKQYASLNPLFPVVIKFIEENDLSSLTPGKHVIEGNDLFVNIQEAKPKMREAARIETHRRMIDIQIPITGGEEHGWTPLTALCEAPYDAENDISFYPGEAQTYYRVEPGQMTIYFPEDGHAPAITPQPMRKAIFKVAVK